MSPSSSTAARFHECLWGRGVDMGGFTGVSRPTLHPACLIPANTRRRVWIGGGACAHPLSEGSGLDLGGRRSAALYSSQRNQWAAASGAAIAHTTSTTSSPVGNDRPGREHGAHASRTARPRGAPWRTSRARRAAWPAGTPCRRGTAARGRGRWRRRGWPRRAACPPSACRCRRTRRSRRSRSTTAGRGRRWLPAERDAGEHDHDGLEQLDARAR